jgi:hypothetical protein
MTLAIEQRTLALIAGTSYLIIFFAAIFANFFVIESLLNEPLATVQQDHYYLRAGILAFLTTVVFDVVVAWALYELYSSNRLSALSTLFRMMHASTMAVAVSTLPEVIALTTSEEILKQIQDFNTIWLIGLFFFGAHLILLARIIERPKFIVLFLILAGAMYMADTVAHIALPDYETYASYFLALVATPSILGEMSFTLWLLFKAAK